jgi:hypothetical protein
MVIIDYLHNNSKKSHQFVHCTGLTPLCPESSSGFLTFPYYIISKPLGRAILKIKGFKKGHPPHIAFKHYNVFEDFFKSKIAIL